MRAVAVYMYIKGGGLFKIGRGMYIEWAGSGTGPPLCVVDCMTMISTRNVQTSSERIHGWNRESGRCVKVREAPADDDAALDRFPKVTRRFMFCAWEMWTDGRKAMKAKANGDGRMNEDGGRRQSAGKPN
jgi:hypothetical protein